MTEFKSAAELCDYMIQYAKSAIEPYKPEWAERREIAKTLISLSSAALIFTITFSTSIIKSDTSAFWRYSLLVCWIAFILSLAFALTSLWFAMGLASLPILVEERTQAIISALNDAIKKRASGGDIDPHPAVAIFNEQLDRVAKDDLRVYWSLRIAVFCFAIALLVLTILGVRQLLH